MRRLTESFGNLGLTIHRDFWFFSWLMKHLIAGTKATNLFWIKKSFSFHWSSQSVMNRWVSYLSTRVWHETWCCTLLCLMSDWCVSGSASALLRTLEEPFPIVAVPHHSSFRSPILRANWKCVLTICWTIQSLWMLNIKWFLRPPCLS